MLDAVTLNPTARLQQPNSPKRAVLVTGAAGRIGSYFAEHSHDRYALRLLIHSASDEEELSGFGQVVEGDLGEPASLDRACEGIDTIVHMAGDPSPSASFDDLLQANIIGTYNLVTAAWKAKCRRVIYASSIHAVSGYPADVQVKPSDPVNPGDLYGVSKCFGEALCRYMAEKEGLSCIAIRIGAFQPAEAMKGDGGVNMADAWVSHRDLTQLIRRCIEAEGIQFAIFNGLSDNRFKRLDISNARELLGYAPEDDSTRTNAELQPLHLADRVRAHSVEDPGQKSALEVEVSGGERRGGQGVKG